MDTSDTELNKDEKVSPGNVPQLRVETAEETRGATLEVDAVDGAAVSRCRSLSFKEPTLPGKGPPGCALLFWKDKRLIF